MAGTGEKLSGVVCCGALQDDLQRVMHIGGSRARGLCITRLAGFIDGRVCFCEPMTSGRRMRSS